MFSLGVRARTNHCVHHQSNILLLLLLLFGTFSPLVYCHDYAFLYTDIYPVMLDDDARYQCQVSPGPAGKQFSIQYYILFIYFSPKKKLFGILFIITYIDLATKIK